ncbi:type IV toxin-antitoxin system AbiEi family antitoxin domain-containing protein [Pseudobutyrivibrio xylanivorans]|uniref:Type IV toxin-antitoxin system AbiEi family antitoxin domain-containing protein n=1 Tax=Pseudobutyrivibrio xylanivorans TaxID=185007 RepID=A0A5P6VNL3_PSEXY|nr:type IV toxin-antitoxin system AbiEi family antitoxin domain-containing protein [Pseudobutyrivibrio xylanivorans]QFJ54167.1 type IV toxin-antitoxin system AbiEi family antitoxin domain-containing protein [Pseudobutyrivibrio xylanivorans]
MEMLLSRDEKKQYQLEQINDLVEKNGGLVKASDIDALGVDYRRVLKFVEEGYLIRVKSGYYTTKYFECDEDQWIYKLFGEDGILTMESALYVYGYLKDRPYKWSIAINKNTSKSRFNIDYPIVEPYYTEPEVLEIGVTEANFAGAKMKIYTKERLICDFLKYQEKVDREDFKKGVWAYIMDEDKDVAKLMEYAKERKVLKKVQSMIGVWL